MINWLKDKEKDIEPEKLKEYKLRAAVLAAAYGMEHKRSAWWVDLDGDVRLILYNPKERLGKE